MPLYVSDLKRLWISVNEWQNPPPAATFWNLSNIELLALTKQGLAILQINWLS